MDSGSVLTTPSVKDGTCWLAGSSRPMPIFLASRYGRHSPVRSSSLAKNVFTDCWVPV